MESEYIPQSMNEGSEENAVHAAVPLAIHILDAGLKIVEVVTEELERSGQPLQQEDPNERPVFLPWYETAAYKQQQEQKLAAVRSELASFIPAQPESTEGTQSEIVFAEPMTSSPIPASIT